VDEFPLVSIVVPCRNEERFIAMCLDSILTNDYPRELLEILVVDGMSDDGTKAIVEGYEQRHMGIRLLINPEMITPVSLNLGIQNATGDIIFWMSAHNRYEKDYVSRSVRCLQAYKADNVGGIMISLPREETMTGRAIVRCLGHRFGVGNSYFRIPPDKPRWVDTVFGGCYRRDVFDRVGLFNPRLVRGQDMEFNRRLRKAGGRILLVPDIVSYYYARSDIKSFWIHNLSNGLWAILPFLYSTTMPVSWRHLVPLLFVMGLAGSAALGIFWSPGLWVWLSIGSCYGAVNLASSCHIAWQERDLKYLLVMPVMFASLHMGYGLGSLGGLFRVLGSKQFWGRFHGEKDRVGEKRTKKQER
jgi:glycosyltransferase involved in cell wall biosynthesis